MWISAEMGENTQWFGATGARALRPHKRSSDAVFASRPAKDGPPEIRAAFTSQDTAGRVSVMKPYVAAEGPRLVRCSGIRWARLVGAALASTTTRPRSEAQRAARPAYNHSTPEHPSGYTVTGRRFQQGGRYKIGKVRTAQRKTFADSERYRYTSGEPSSSSCPALCSCPLLLLLLLSPLLEAHLHETRANAGAPRRPATKTHKQGRVVSPLFIWWQLDPSAVWPFRNLNNNSGVGGGGITAGFRSQMTRAAKHPPTQPVTSDARQPPTSRLRRVCSREIKSALAQGVNYIIT